MDKFIKILKTKVTATIFLGLVLFIAPLPSLAQTAKTFSVQTTGSAMMGQDFPVRILTSDSKQSVKITIVASDPAVTLSNLTGSNYCDTKAGGFCDIYFNAALVGQYTLNISSPGYTTLTSSPINVKRASIILSASPQTVLPGQDSKITAILTNSKKDIDIQISGVPAVDISANTCKTVNGGYCIITFNQKSSTNLGKVTITAQSAGYAQGTVDIDVVNAVSAPAPVNNCPPGKALQGTTCVDVNTLYTMLEPLGGIGPTVDTGSSSSFANYLNIMIKIFIGICAALAMVMIVVGGIEYMTTELVSHKDEGKQRILAALGGLMLAFGSYMLLNTINPDLLQIDPGIQPVTLAVLGEDIPQTPVNGNYTAPGGTQVAAGANWANIAGAPATLPAGVTVSPTGDCATVGQAPCTSTRGLNLSIVNSIMAGCPTCRPVITGGTEFWRHSPSGSHKVGSATIDLRANPDINTYITGNSAFPNNGQYYPKNGVTYLAEKAGQTANTTAPHWHAYK